MSNAKYFGGIPTKPDVDKLAKAFSGLREGDEITHDEVEAIIGVHRDAQRYRSVTTAWRRHMLNNANVEIGAVPGEGFRVLTPSERLTTNYAGFRSGARKQARSVNRITRIKDNELSGAERANRDHIQRAWAVISSAVSDSAKKIEPPKPVERISILPTKTRTVAA